MIGDNEFDLLIKNALNLKYIEEQKIADKLILEVQKDDLKMKNNEVRQKMKVFKIHLLKQRLINAVEYIWRKQSEIVHSFGELILKAREKNNLSIKQIALAAEMSIEELERFERSSRPILETKNIPKLVNILELFGINLDMLMGIINCENKYFLNSIQAQKAASQLHGVQKSRYIDGPKYIMPSLPNFISKIREEIEKRELYDLLT